MGSSKRAAKCCSFSAPGLPDGTQLLKTLPNSTSNASQNEPKIAPKSPWGHLLEPGGCLVRVLGYPPPPKVQKIIKNRQKNNANNHKNTTYKKVLCLQNTTKRPAGNFAIAAPLELATEKVTIFDVDPTESLATILKYL